MVSDISQIIPLPVSSTHEARPQQPSSSADTVVANSTQNTASVDNVNVSKSVINNHGSAVTTSGLLGAAVDYLNANIQNLNRNLVFSIDQQSGEVLVKILDANTHELIRQIPSEEALALARNIERYILNHHVGLLHQAKA